jgi:3-oxoacyl-[acyl-carrier protein] reductase
MNTTHFFQNKIAIVSGGGRGIGRAIARRLAQDGAHVVFSFKSDEATARETVAAIEQYGGAVRAIQSDWSNDEGITRFFDQFERDFRSVDFLINNAGIATFAPLENVSTDEFDAMFALNVRGLFFATQRAAKFMRDGGRIINISSGITRVNAAGGSAYAASKAAVEAFSRCWAAELGARQITVNTVSPGMTETDLLAQVMSPAALESMKTQTLLGRLGQPADIADAVALLCSEEARWLTAQNILANGGAV